LCLRHLHLSSSCLCSRISTKIETIPVQPAAAHHSISATAGIYFVVVWHKRSLHAFTARLRSMQWPIHRKGSASSRVGYAARGLVYILLGYLGLSSAGEASAGPQATFDFLQQVPLGSAPYPPLTGTISSQCFVEAGLTIGCFRGWPCGSTRNFASATRSVREVRNSAADATAA
jgi:hypothetical protein